MSEKIKTFKIELENPPDGKRLISFSKQEVVYTGETTLVESGEIPHGKGRCVWEDNKATYEGDWVDGKMSGYGVYYIDREFISLFGDFDSWTYEGCFENGMFHGHGVQKSVKNGWSYDGEWKDGFRHGKGIYTDQYGSVYEGTWNQDSLYGYGTCKSAHSIYEGNFEFNKFSGYGVLKGEKWSYEGEWEGNFEHGKGVGSCKDYTWDGEWERGHIRGNGIYTSKDGWVFTGEWRGSHGSGKIVFPNGDTYEGEVSAPGVYHPVSELCMHGKGVYTFADGRVYDEGFVYGEFHCDYMEKVRAADAIKEAERRKAAEEYRAKKKKEREERRKNLTEEDYALRKRLEEECKALYGEETDIKKRYEILKRAFFAAHNSGFNDAMAWELSIGGSPSTHVWQQAIGLKWEVEKLCEYYELEVEED